MFTVTDTFALTPTMINADPDMGDDAGHKVQPVFGVVFDVIWGLRKGLDPNDDDNRQDEPKCD